MWDLDSSSFSLEGSYELESSDESSESIESVKITYGYSKDHRLLFKTLFNLLASLRNVSCNLTPNSESATSNSSGHVNLRLSVFIIQLIGSVLPKLISSSLYSGGST